MFYVQSTITVISGRRRKNEKKKERKKERKEKKGEASSLWGILLSSCQLSPHCPQRLALKTRRPSAFARVWTLTEVDFKRTVGRGGKIPLDLRSYNGAHYRFDHPCRKCSEAGSDDPFSVEGLSVVSKSLHEITIPRTNNEKRACARADRH